MESQRPRGLEVKRSKVRGGNGRGERAGTGWDPREGKAKETEGELRKPGRYPGVGGTEAQQVQVRLGRAGIPRVPGPPGPASPIASTQAEGVSCVHTPPVLLQH